MISAELPENESERLKKLNDYQILDTLAEQEYDDIVSLAAYICNTPIALISLIDEDRQWFKAKRGLDSQQTNRDIAFCAHAILGDKVFVVPDSTKDERFYDNPLVTGPVQVKFYAGAPITTPEGFKIGTLCVLDNTPRKLTQEQLDALKSLSRSLVSILELRLKLIEREEFFVKLQESERKSSENKMQKEALEATNKIAQSYARFIPSEFLSFLHKDSITDLKLGDFTEDTMTILFSDIRGFTTLSEKMNSHDLLKFLNSYLSVASPIIKSNFGFIDKFIGDAIMAIFPQSPLNALYAAIELCKELEKYNASREKKIRQTFRIGIGMHTGKMALGTIGSEERMDTTVVGDTVNLASRLESLTKIFHVPILISDSFYSMLETEDRIDIREIDIVIVKGKSIPVRVYEVFSTDSEDVIQKKRESIPDLKKAIQYFREGNILEARSLFIKCQRVCPEDSIPVVYIHRCDKAIEDSKSKLMPKPGSENKTVLIVDDNIAILELMKFSLRKNNFNVITSSNGKDAVLKYGEHNPGYVLLDLNMPDMDGFKVAEIIKDFASLRSENPLFIFVTSNDDPEIREKILGLGYEFLPKPLLIKDLLAIIENFSNQKSYPRLNLQNVYREALDNLVAGCQVIDFEYKYIYVNEIAIRHSGKMLKELIGNRITDVYPGIENTELFKEIQTCMEKRIPIQMKNDFHFADGRISTFNLIIEPDPNGVLILSMELVS